MAGDLKNNGRYEWLADRNLPDRIHLRLEVRDEAGNIAVAQTTEPIVKEVRKRTTKPQDRHGSSIFVGKKMMTPKS